MAFVRHPRTFLTVLACLLGTVGALLVGAGPANANDNPTSIGVEGDNLAEPIVVRADTQRDLFTALLRQVNWMVGASGVPIHPDPATLGPRFIVTVYVNDKPVGVYHLYPESSGGPRAFRPADQPGGKTSEAWFYASVAMPDTLRAAGISLNDSATAQTRYNNPGGVVPLAASSSARPVGLRSTVGGQSLTLLAWLGTALALLLVVLAAARYSYRARHGRKVALAPVVIPARRLPATRRAARPMNNGPSMGTASMSTAARRGTLAGSSAPSGTSAMS